MDLENWIPLSYSSMARAEFPLKESKREVLF